MSNYFELYNSFNILCQLKFEQKINEQFTTNIKKRPKKKKRNACSTDLFKSKCNQGIQMDCVYHDPWVSFNLKHSSLIKHVKTEFINYILSAKGRSYPIFSIFLASIFGIIINF